MARRPRTRQCARCGKVSPGKLTRCPDCGTPLVKWHFKMTPGKIKAVHAIANQKGLDRTAYEDNLHAVGVETCKDMKQKHFDEYLKRMARLPDAPAKVA